MAFPTTPVLDSFNRANAILTSGNWGLVNINGAGAEIVSNAVTGNSGGGSGWSYWTPTMFRRDSEAFFTLTTKWLTDGQGAALMLNLQTPSVSPDVSGYFLTIYGSAGDIAEIYRIDASVFTKLGATATGLSIAAGDKFGVCNLGGTLNMYQFTAGAWNQTPIISRSDSTYGDGYIGLEIDSNLIVVDDFGGGGVVTGFKREAHRPFPFKPGSSNLSRF